MKYIDLIRKQLAELAEERAALLAEGDAMAEARDAWGDTEETRSQAILDRLSVIKTEEAPLLEREAQLAEHEQRAANARLAPVGGMKKADDLSDVRGDATRLGSADARARAITMIEESRSFVRDEHKANLVNLIERSGSSVGAAAARMALTTHDPNYVSAWSKVMTGRGIELNEAERVALSRGRDDVSAEERAMTSGTGNSGGYFVPVFVDPTMIITGAGSVSFMRDIATVKTIGPAFGGWYGATAAQVTAAWTSEGSAAPDNTPTVTQPNIPVYMAEAHVNVSFQAFEDISDLAGDVIALFSDARNNLEATAFQTGTGSSQPTGIVTAAAQVTASRVSPTTGGTYGVDDTYLLHSALPARFRNSGSLAWMGNIAVLDRTRKLLMAQNSANSAWTDASRGVPPTLLGDSIYEASPMSSSFTTGQDILLYGDFSRYFIIDRIGFSVEFIPNYFDTSTGRPTAQRGWLAHWRTGGNTVDANAFRILRL